MGISDVIADFISDILNDAESGTAELQRSELANRFGCVPSQINYVISTRFSPEHGYIVESRRGGNGYIRISRVRMAPGRLIMHTVNSVGEEIDHRSVAALLSNAAAGGAIDQSSARLMIAATSDAALRSAPPVARDRLRSDILKQMLINTLHGKGQIKEL